MPKENLLTRGCLIVSNVRAVRISSASVSELEDPPCTMAEITLMALYANGSFISVSQSVSIDRPEGSYCTAAFGYRPSIGIGILAVDGSERARCLSTEVRV